MTDNRLYKSEKLCSCTAIDRMINEGDAAKGYPLRAVYRLSEGSGGKASAQFLITIPKKKIRKAVERVLLRRRVREAYRLNRNLLLPVLTASGKHLEVAFIYVSQELSTYSAIENGMQKILRAISCCVAPAETSDETAS